MSPFCAVDRNARRYTTSVWAGSDDWWCGALILTPSLIARLKRENLLPLTEVVFADHPALAE